MPRGIAAAYLDCFDMIVENVQMVMWDEDFGNELFIIDVP